MTAPAPAGRKTRILYLIGSFRNGGAEKSMTQVLTHLDRSRFVPHAACFQPGGTYFPRVQALGIPLRIVGIRAPLYRPRNIVPVLGLARELRRQRVDLVHSYLVSANIVAILAGRLARVPVICSLRSIDSLKTRSLMAAHLWALRQACAITAVSDAAKKSYVDRGIPPTRITVLENGVEIPDARPSKKQSRDQFDLAPESLIVTTVATLVPEKDHATLIEAAHRLQGEIPGLLFVFAGAGKLEEGLRRKIRERNLEGTVRLLGHVEDVPAILNASDIFCLSSVVEGMSNALLEAMAWGLPAVVTDVGANAHLVRHEETGMVVSPGDVNGLAEAIGKLARNAEKRRLYGQRSVERARANYSVDVMIRRLQDFYVSTQLGDTEARGGAR